MEWKNKLGDEWKNKLGDRFGYNMDILKWIVVMNINICRIIELNL